MSKDRGFERVLSKVSRIHRGIDKKAVIALLLTSGFVLAYVLLLVSQEVRPYGWVYSESLEDDWMTPGHDVSGWASIELPSLEFNRKYSVYYRGFVELSGVVKPDVVVGAQKRIAAVYVNGNEVRDYVKTTPTSVAKFGEAIVLSSSLFKPGKNVLAVQVEEGSQRIINIRSNRPAWGDSAVLLIFYLTPAVMLFALSKRQLDSSKVVLIVFFTLALVFLRPIFHDFGYWGGGDWDQTEGYNAAPRETLLRFMQLPLWNPYVSGGVPLLADPQSTAFSPLFPVVLAFGVIAGMKIKLVLWYVLGMFGMYALGRELKVETYSRYLMAFAFMLSSMYSLHITQSHPQMQSLPLLPWAFLFYLKALKEPGYAAVSALLMAFMIFDGGLYMLVYTATFLALYASLTAVRMFLDSRLKKDALKPVTTLIIVGLLCSAFSAVKTLPMLEHFQDYPRPTDERDPDKSTYSGYSPAELQYAFLGLTQNKHVPDFNTAVWDNYGAYLGPIVVLLALGGMVLLFRTHWPLALIVLFGLALVLGKTQSEMALWSLLHHLPLFSSMRYASRLLTIAFFPITVLSGLMASRIEGRSRLVALVLAVLVFYNLAYVDSETLNNAFILAPRSIQPTAFTHVKDVFEGIYVYSESYMHILQNQGVVNFYASLRGLTYTPTEVKAAGEEGYLGEVYPESGRGAFSIDSYTPNHIALTVDAGAGDTLVVNQNYEQGWKTTSGNAVYSKDGLMAVNVTPSQGKVVLYYSPTGFKVGLAVTLLALLGAFKYLRLAKGRRGMRNYARSLGEMSSVACVALILLASHYGVELVQSGRLF